jgi:hypothetical protein
MSWLPRKTPQQHDPRLLRLGSLAPSPIGVTYNLSVRQEMVVRSMGKSPKKNTELTKLALSVD